MSQGGSSKRLQQTQAQVDEVVGIMRTNVEKVLERDQKLSELDDRADALQQGASQFEQQAGKLKRKYWWKNLKMMLILGFIVLIILIVIIALGNKTKMSRGHHHQAAVVQAQAGHRVHHRSRSSNPNRRQPSRHHHHLSTLRITQYLDENFTFISPSIKYFLFFFNLIVWLFGCLLIGLGAWSFLEEYTDYTAINIRTVIDLLLNISLFIIVFGTIVFIMSFTGCIGALRENLFLLRSYSIILLILFVFEVVLSAIAILFPGSFLNLVKEAFSNEPIIKYRDDSNLQNIIDLVQTEFRCCGVSDKGYKDWSKNIYFECTDTNPSRERCAVPYSCCRNPRNLDSGLINNECGFNMQNISSVVEVNKDIYTRGCIEAITETIAPHISVLAYVCISIAVIQLFLMFLARSLQGQISAQLSRWNNGR